MARVCVINLSGVSGRLLERQSGLWVNSLPSEPRPIGATFPAVPASVQASMTTGAEPGVHGIVSGGVYRRQCHEVSFAERSNTLLNKKRFWQSRHLPAPVTASMVFWWHPLAGAAELVVASAGYAPPGLPIPQQPAHLYDQVARRLGELNQSLLWGPGASWRSSQWMSSAAREIWADYLPDLQWVTLCGVDFAQVRHGVESADAADALREVDQLAQRLGEQVIAGGGRVVVISDGGYVPVERAGRPNWLLRQAGLLKVCQGAAGETIDLNQSRAFCLADHQMAHLYCEDERLADEAADMLRQDAAIVAVLGRDELFSSGLGHDRAGERIVLAQPDAWLTYAWWGPDDSPPPVAIGVAPQFKCGYDPCELFAGASATQINPDTSLVRASRGLVTPPLADQCFVAASCDIPPIQDVCGLPDLLKSLLFDQDS